MQMVNIGDKAILSFKNFKKIRKTVLTSVTSVTAPFIYLVLKFLYHPIILL